ncbi:hypothetical protein PC129_g24361 [Phytophthora cactorum]|uniref:Uncharacterized protein n=1 Tax=Phytophthora cactorum TaxID=29920 RepID=A0A8T1AEG8_9STRA|nr:hypothetical protein Pcac1_g10829 [Phytophthora cactorum]KAG2870931.1 hypothetical protein PC114_g27155 [Phytophthora cactorum]KAG2876435.1 hypothetical protein PC117_g27243 [Phytophthora cactorum]KAG2957923.1 hypothetical protein PC119_g27183 [Phytophthora cactorum]KAG3121935.1 hypothetical protein C6341_g27177 [Phytophthora cactorum]
MEKMKMKCHRMQERGGLISQTVATLPMSRLKWSDAQEERIPWAKSRLSATWITKMRIGDVIKIDGIAKKDVVFRPVTHTLPNDSVEAHQFRKPCLSLLAQFPELASAPGEEDVVQVHHGPDDPHHRFWVAREND